MIRICANIPDKFVLGLSGGVDSMVAYHFFKKGGKDFIPAFYHHNTDDSEAAFSFLKNEGISFETEKLTERPDKKESKEDFWRRKRYNFLNSFNLPIITAHHLDDAVESWIISTMIYGNPRVMNSVEGNRIRPFLKTKKQTLKDFAIRHSINWIEDKSNSCNDYKRNFIRNKMMGDILQISPGIHKIVSKKIK